jgi:hypothetical protein
MPGLKYCTSQEAVTNKYAANNNYQEKIEETLRKTCCSAISSIKNLI